jgi:isochorismate synthase
MKLMDGEALLYAGAGVTVDSEPEKELAETEMKFRTLLNIL